MNETIQPVPARIDQQQLAQHLVDAARADGVELVGLDRLLTGLTTTVLETPDIAAGAVPVRAANEDRVVSAIGSGTRG
jgi:hypothetical protein